MINWIKELYKSWEDNLDLLKYQSKVFSSLNNDKQIEIVTKLRETVRNAEIRALKFTNKLCTK